MSHSIFDSINMNNISIFIKYILSVIAGLFLITGCVEEYEAELPKDDTQLLVVDGTICSNQHNRFRLTLSSSIKNEIEYDGVFSSYKAYSEPDPVIGAKVTICGTDGTVYECTEEKNTEKKRKDGYYDEYYGLYVYYDDYGNTYYSEDEEYEDLNYCTGVYSCDLPELDPNVSYFVTIKYQKDIYQSTPEQPISTPGIDSLECFQKDSLSNVEVLLTSAMPDDPNEIVYYSWDYSQTWEVRPLRTTFIIFEPSTGKIRYRMNDEVFPKRGWKKLEHSETVLTESTAHYADGRFSKYQLLDFTRNDIRVRWYYCVDVTQRAISKAEYEYEMACRQAGWEMGGLFSPQPSDMPTNIRCLTSSKKVIGYVGCSQNVAKKRMYIDGTKISRELPELGPGVKLYDLSNEAILNMQNNGNVLYEWDDGRDIHNPLITYWGSLPEFDVRLQGATVEKPDYMPPFDEE